MKSIRKIIFAITAIFATISAFSADFDKLSDGFVLIKGGTFTMGSPKSEDWRCDDETQHKVKLSSFYISKYEVTQKLYREVMGENPSNFKCDNLPVESVSWLDAVKFCNELSKKRGRIPVYSVSADGRSVSWNRAANGYRLPTEAEWEYAARAGTTTPFYTKKVPGASDVNFYGHYPYQIEQNYFNDEVLETRPGVYRGNTTPVGSFAANPNGLFDVYGNVGEWCFDYYDEYVVATDNNAVTNPVGAASGSRRVYRGGGWNDFGKNLRSAYRAASEQNTALFNVGIRLACNATSDLADTVTTTESSTGIFAAKPAGNKALIVFFSWGGNTRGVAREIRNQTGFDMVELQLVHPYSSSYNTVLNEAQRDQHNQARPELKTKIADFDQYGTIILGYPNWWASIPMPIATLLESYDFSGKWILPFCSHGGGRFGQSLSAIAKLAPKSRIGEGLSVHYSGGSSLGRDVEKWLKKNGVK